MRSHALWGSVDRSGRGVSRRISGWAHHARRRHRDRSRDRRRRLQDRQQRLLPSRGGRGSGEEQEDRRLSRRFEERHRPAGQLAFPLDSREEQTERGWRPGLLRQGQAHHQGRRLVHTQPARNSGADGERSPRPRDHGEGERVDSRRLDLRRQLRRRRGWGDPGRRLQDVACAERRSNERQQRRDRRRRGRLRVLQAAHDHRRLHDRGQLRRRLGLPPGRRHLDQLPDEDQGPAPVGGVFRAFEDLGQHLEPAGRGIRRWRRDLCGRRPVDQECAAERQLGVHRRPWRRNRGGTAATGREGSSSQT